MKTYYGNYLGMVIDNNDPEFRGRVQVFIPHIMPTLYEDWNQSQEKKTIRCVGDNIPEGLNSAIVERLKKILPWAEAASPIMAQSGPGNVAGPNGQPCIPGAPVSVGGGDGGDTKTPSASGTNSSTGTPSTSGTNTSSSGSNSGKKDAPIFVGGLINVSSQEKQLSNFKEGIGGGEVTGFGHATNPSDVIAAAKNTTGDIYLYSAGANGSKVEQYLNAGLGPRLRIIEPYNPNPAQMKRAIDAGAKYQIGNSPQQGNVSGLPNSPNIVKTPAGVNHDGAPGKAGSMLGGKGGTSGGSSTASSDSSGGSGAGDCGPTGSGGPGGGSSTLDQSPTSYPAGTIPPGNGKCTMPANGGTQVNMLVPPFADRLSALYKEGSQLGYRFNIYSGYRTHAHQQYLWTKNNGKGTARPGYSQHEYGLAVDMAVSGPGVSISVAMGGLPAGKRTPESQGWGCVEACERNFGTQTFHALMMKYRVSMPLRTPANRRGRHQEAWHCEPIEVPGVGGDRDNVKLKYKIEADMRAQKSNSPSNESTSSSQVPALATPLANAKSGGSTTAVSPTTNQVSSQPTPIAQELQKNANANSSSNTSQSKTPQQQQQNRQDPATSSSSTTSSPPVQDKKDSAAAKEATPSSSSSSTSTTASPSTPTNTTAPPVVVKGATWTGNLAKDRATYFQGQLTDWVMKRLSRLCFNQEYKGPNVTAGSIVLESIINKTFFAGTTLAKSLEDGYYMPRGELSPVDDRIKQAVQRVVFQGQNKTDLATDNASNLKGAFYSKLKVQHQCTGNFWKLLQPESKQRVTDEKEAATYVNALQVGANSAEWIGNKDGRPGDVDYRVFYALNAAKYRKMFNPPCEFGLSMFRSAEYGSAVPPTDVIKNAAASDLTGNTPGAGSVNDVNQTDPHGPTAVKNTNDSPKGMFTYPAVGAMVWIFFIEGNPQFPVYFAASFSAAEWSGAYSGGSLNPQGTNIGNAGTQMANSTKWSPNAGGGFEFTHTKDSKDPSGGYNATAMMYGDDGSNMTFTRGYHQLYTRHDRRDQTDGNGYKTIGGAEEKWVSGDSSKNVRGNMFIKIGKIDDEGAEAAKELADFSKQMNDILHEPKK